jgi:hypothetical protein
MKQRKGFVSNSSSSSFILSWDREKLLYNVLKEEFDKIFIFKKEYFNEHKEEVISLFKIKSKKYLFSNLLEFEEFQKKYKTYEDNYILQELLDNKAVSIIEEMSENKGEVESSISWDANSWIKSMITENIKIRAFSGPGFMIFPAIDKTQVMSDKKYGGYSIIPFHPKERW